jgi:hypothetical protein
LRRGEFTHTHPGGFRRRIGQTCGVDRLTYGPFDEQFFFAEHEIQRGRCGGWTGHASILPRVSSPAWRVARFETVAVAYEPMP